MPLGLLALAIASFGIGLTEFVIMGLLPEVAADFHVDEAAAGWLISGYALSVVVGALGLTIATLRLPRKAVLVGLLMLFVVGNVLTASATTYQLAMAGRIIAALTHGAFFGIGSVVATALVPPAKKAGAIAILFTGLTAANVFGVPFGTFLGQQAGWRSTFWAISVVGVIALIGLAALIPNVRASETPSLRTEVTAFRAPQVWFSLAVTVLAYGGMFGAFSYIAYTLTNVTGFPETAVPWLLVIFGAGLVLGNWVGGKLADRSVDGTLIGFITALVVVLAVFALFPSNPAVTVISLFLMGAFGFGTVPGLQTRIMGFAKSAPTLASGANIGAFNVGNALGAWVGGVIITAGLGFAAPLWAGAAIGAVSLVVMLVAATLAHTRAGKKASGDPARPATGSTPRIAL